MWISIPKTDVKLVDAQRVEVLKVDLLVLNRVRIRVRVRACLV